MADQNNQENKLALLDLIKMLIIIPGLTYHTSEYLNLPEKAVGDIAFTVFLINYSRFFYFIGFIATFCAFFTIGLKPGKQIFNLKRTLLILAGLALLSYTYRDPEAPFFGTEWTFYHFVIVALAVIHFVNKVKKNIIHIALVVLSSSILFIPFWKMTFLNFSLPLKIVLIGNCSESNYGEWPLLPWIFIPIFSVSLARVMKENKYFEKMHLAEYFVWTITILGLGIVYWGDYFALDSGNGFSCGVFAQSNLAFWAHFLPFVFLIRLNFVKNVKKLLSKFKFFNFLQSIFWIKQFGLSYFLSLLTIGILSLFINGNKIEGKLSNIYTICFFIALLTPEIIQRIRRNLFK